MSPSSELLKQLAREVAMAPQEQLMEVGRRKKSLSIGIPKEITFIIGEFAGDDDTVAIEDDDYTSHIADYVTAQPDND